MSNAEARRQPDGKILGVPVDHYENFPVASWLCPADMRPAVLAIYHFARTADDLADEGDDSAEVRRAQLADYRAALHASAQGKPATGAWPQVFGPLRGAMRDRSLPLPLLDALLDAFVQDTYNPAYATRGELVDYCRRSANPVGRLLLHLHGTTDALSLAQSDAICTALQLINFWQDLSVDLPRGRCYVPAEDAARAGLAAAQLQAGHDTPATRTLVRELCAWAQALMAQGAPLACRLQGRLGWELRLVVQGGLRILDIIRAMDYQTLLRRPVLGKTDAPLLLWRAWRMRVDRPTPGFGTP